MADQQHSRTYYLTLFHQFMKAVRAVAALRTEEPTGVATAARSARRGPVYAVERQRLALRKQMSNRMRPHALACFAVLALLGSCAAALEASAATITVTNGLDARPGVNVTGCTLREAVNAINIQRNDSGCNNSSNQRYGDHDVIRIASGVNTIRLSNPAGFNANAALRVQRPVTIRGNGPLVTTITGERGPLTLIENFSELRLYRLRLSDARTALVNLSTAAATLWSVHVTGHSSRAVVNRGRMSMLSVTIQSNFGGGGIYNGNDLPADVLGSSGSVENFLMCVSSGVSPEECGHDDQQDIAVPGEDIFPAGEAPAALTILRSVISNNNAQECAGILNAGGVIQATSSLLGGGTRIVAGSVTVRQSRIVNNWSNDRGGGICNLSAAFISQSEISRNTATRGGGVAAFSDIPIGLMVTNVPRPFTTIVMSTISSNLAFTVGGGLFVGAGGGEMSLSNSTVAFNRSNGTGAGDAGGIAAQQPTTVRFGFNALTNNRSNASGAAVQDCGNVTLQGAFNFWAVADMGTCSLTGAGNVTTGDARLGALADNGFPRARSHLPAANSALVDVIPANDPTICNGIDQRSQTRPRNGNNDTSNGCDIGAVERP